MGTTPVQTVSHILVDITPSVADSGSMDKLLFSGCTPPDWSVEAPKHVFHGNKGTPESIIASIQKPTYGTMTLTQGWDPGNVLALWKNQIEKPDVPITDKKKQVTVQFCDSKGATLFQWMTDGACGILTGFSHSGSDASSNGVLSITATIDADNWKLTAKGGGDLTAGP
jgi:hypothetical protein